LKYVVDVPRVRVLPILMLLRRLNVPVLVILKFLIVFVPPALVVLRSKYMDIVPEPPIVRSDDELPTREPDIAPVTAPFRVRVFAPIITSPLPDAPPAQRLNAPFTVRFPPRVIVAKFLYIEKLLIVHGAEFDNILLRVATTLPPKARLLDDVIVILPLLSDMSLPLVEVPTCNVYDPTDK